MRERKTMQKAQTVELGNRVRLKGLAPNVNGSEGQVERGPIPDRKGFAYGVRVNGVLWTLNERHLEVLA